MNNNDTSEFDTQDMEEDVDIPDVDVEQDDSQDVYSPVRFNVTSFGWDSDVEGLVKRIKRGDIFVPAFQRKFVWKGPEKSRFVESLILGLPVPTIFLAKDSATGKLNIVDGQQRLITLQHYLDGKFKLSGKELEPDLVGQYFSSDVAPTKKSKTLDSVDKISLENAIIRAIVINPDPAVDDTEFGTKYNKAVIQIFQRLNTSGKPLQAQEVRSCILHGSMNICLHNMNEVVAWREMFGPEHGRLKDMEALLRYVALLNDGATYSSPMPRFLDDFMEKNRALPKEVNEEIVNNFTTAIELVKAAKGNNFFKNGGTFLLSRFDAIMVAVTELAVKDPTISSDAISKQIDDLMADDTEVGYQWAIEEFVNDTNRVTARLTRARHFLRG